MSPRFEHCLTAIAYIPLCKKKKVLRKYYFLKIREVKRSIPSKLLLKKKKRQKKREKLGLILVTIDLF